MNLPKFNFSRLAAISAFVILPLASAADAQQSPAQPMRADARAFSLFFEGGGSYLGVQTENVSKENAGKYNLSEPRGVAVVKVSENSPAAQAGLRDRDVIVRFEGEEIKSVAKLQRLIQEVAPDQKARVTILRNGAEQELSVTMGKRPEPQFRSFGNFPDGAFTMPPMQNMPRLEQLPRTETLPREYDDLLRSLPRGGDNLFVYPSGAGARRLGVGVSSLNKQLGEYFGVADGKGVLIESVVENSPAAKAGLKAGDVIVEIEGEAVTNQADLIRALNKKAEGEISLMIVRNKQRQTVRLTPEASKNAIAPGKTMKF